MNPHAIAERLRAWPTPRDWPAIVQKLTNEETGEELGPTRRRAWLLWRLACVHLSGLEVADDADNWDIAQTVTVGQLRVFEYSVRSAAGERLRPCGLRRRDISSAFTRALFAAQPLQGLIHQNTDPISG